MSDFTNDQDQSAPFERLIIDGDFPMLISPGLHEFFMAHGRLGIEAESLYIHLQYTARLQETNQVWANDSYIKTGIKIGSDKVKALKAFLHKAGLTEYVRTKENGRVTGTYIRLKYIHRRETVERLFQEHENRPVFLEEEVDTTGVKTTPVEGSTGVISTGVIFNRVASSNKCLKQEKENALSEKRIKRESSAIASPSRTLKSLQEDLDRGISPDEVFKSGERVCAACEQVFSDRRKKCPRCGVPTSITDPEYLPLLVHHRLQAIRAGWVTERWVGEEENLQKLCEKYADRLTPLCDQLAATG